MTQGAILSLEQCWQLALAFYGSDKRAPEWRRKTADEIETLFIELGFTSSFWSLR